MALRRNLEAPIEVETLNHPALEAVRAALPGTPWEGRVWLVGGAIRDALLGRDAGGEDLDLVLEGDAPAFARHLWKERLSTIPPVIYARFGTAMVRVKGVSLELVTARKESYDPDSRKPDVEPASLLEDARRRDFTLNALFANVETRELFDPTGGLEDLQAKVLRTPLDPVATFRDDPLRMLRAVRFRWRFGFEYAPGLAEAIRSESERMSVLSAERIRDEFSKILLGPSPDLALDDLRELRLLAQFAPDLQAMVGVEQGKWHAGDVWDHTRSVVAKTPPELHMRLAGLLHDVGKPPTRSIDDKGDTRFFSHEVVGAEMTVEFMRRLRYPLEISEIVRLLVRNHMRLGTAPKFTPSAARRLVRDLQGHDQDLLTLVEADKNSLRAGVHTMDLEPIREAIARANLITPRSTLESPLTGQEIMELLDLRPGPKIGEVKAMLLEKVLEGDLQPGDKESARVLALEFGR